MTESYKVLSTVIHRVLWGVLLHGVLWGSLLLSGCGGTTTNPVEGYNDLRGRAVPRTDPGTTNPKPDATNPPPGGPAVTPKSPTGAEGLFPPPNTQGEVLNFIEGEEKSYTLDMPVLLTGASFSVTAEGLPRGSELKKTEGTKYTLKWAPKGVVPQGRKSTVVKIKVVLKGSGFKDSKSLEAFKRSVRSHKLELHVMTAANTIPLIKNINVASHTISEGDQVAITVIVFDKNTQTAPDLKILDVNDSATEGPSLSEAAKLMKFDGPGEALGNSLFKFSGKFTADKSVLPKTETPNHDLTARFGLQAVNTSSKEISPLSTVELKILRQIEEQNGMPADGSDHQ